MLKNNIVLLLLIGLLSSCNSFLEPKEYINWIDSEDNGMFGSKIIGELEYKIQYKPHDYIALKTKLRNSKVDFNQSKKQLGDLQYFTFQLKSLKGTNSPLKLNLKSEEEYYERVSYLSFEIENDIKLIENGDTLKCVLAVFERNYNIAPISTFSLAFEKAKNTKELNTKEFVFNDRVFKNGPIKLKIQQDNLKNIPQLKI